MKFKDLKIGKRFDFPHDLDWKSAHRQEFMKVSSNTFVNPGPGHPVVRINNIDTAIYHNTDNWRK